MSSSHMRNGSHLGASGKTIDKEDQVRSFVDVVFYNSELIGYCEFVIFWSIKINQPDNLTSIITFVLYGYFYSFCEQPVEGFVIGYEFR